MELQKPVVHISFLCDHTVWYASLEFWRNYQSRS